MTEELAAEFLADLSSTLRSCVPGPPPLGRWAFLVDEVRAAERNGRETIVVEILGHLVRDQRTFRISVDANDLCSADLPSSASTVAALLYEDIYEALQQGKVALEG